MSSPVHMVDEPGNRAGPVGGTNFVFCSYGKFNPGYRDEKCAKGRPPKYPWNCVPTCQRPYKPRTAENVSSRTVPVSGLECSCGKNFQLGYRDLGRKKRDPGNRACPPSQMNTSKFLSRKEWRGEISETEPARSTGPI